ncbi:MAG: hypothetical protein H0T84_13190 [Tatlockia sp.]|nr:hypothetical protein [Tatlockia sp.]
MKISSEAGELQIDVYSRFLFRFWGFMFIAAGLVFLLPMLVQYQIHCDDKGYNKANQCILRTSFLKIVNKNISLGELKSATVSNFEGRANTIFYCLLLNTSEGYIKIPNINSKKNMDIVYIAETIEKYIKTSMDKSTNIPKVESWWSYLKVAIFPLLGFGSLLFRLITINFSKKTKTVRIAAKNLINTHETKIAFCDVEKIIIEEHGQNHKEYSLALLLKNGDHIELPGLHDSSLKQIEEIAEKITPFLAASLGEKN